MPPIHAIEALRHDDQLANSELPLSPIEKLELVPEWLRTLVLLGVMLLPIGVLALAAWAFLP